MELVSCDLCGCSTSTFVIQQTDKLHATTKEYFKIVRCDRCGLCYTNPRPDTNEIGAYYPKGYSFHENPSFFRVFARKILNGLANSPFSGIAWFIPHLSRMLAARVMPRLKDPVLECFNDGLRDGLLDIGCGSGNHANIWGHNGGLLAYRRLMPVAGIDISSKAREILGSFGIRAWANIDLVPSQDQWSIIRMNWSLEHVHYPSLYFEFISKHLKPGGRAIICVPNYEGLLCRLAPDCVELPIHLHHFTRKHIDAYAAKYGLRVREFRTFSYPAMFFSAVDAGMLSSKFGSNMGISEARQFQRVLERFDRSGFGNDMIAIMERSN